MTAAEIKKIKSLKDKKFREEYGLFVVEGDKLVAEALASDFDVIQVYRKEEIGEEAMSRISQFSTPSPSLALVRIPKTSGEISTDGLCLGLDAVRDPGNLGTIIRLADWFGVQTVYCSEDCVDLYNSKTIQATMGAIFRKKVVYCSLENVCEEFHKSGKPVYGTFMKGKDIYRSDLAGSALIIMGNEANGISGKIESLCSERLTIPSFTGGEPTSESLNVSTATAVTLSEFRRR